MATAAASAAGDARAAATATASAGALAAAMPHSLQSVELPAAETSILLGALAATVCQSELEVILAEYPEVGEFRVLG